MERSKIGSSRDVNDIRTSSGVFLENNKLTSKIEKRISSIMNVPASHGEGLHILNYEDRKKKRNKSLNYLAL
ncbi:hypothetical protein BLX88_06415 [Bacillus obstructivus]|nr:hypothetical protein BLX88_06415 [Bacillus obstructivus]